MKIDEVVVLGQTCFQIYLDPARLTLIFSHISSAFVGNELLRSSSFHPNIVGFCFFFKLEDLKTHSPNFLPEALDPAVQTQPAAWSSQKWLVCSWTMRPGTFLSSTELLSNDFSYVNVGCKFISRINRNPNAVIHPKKTI